MTITIHCGDGHRCTKCGTDLAPLVGHLVVVWTMSESAWRHGAPGYRPCMPPAAQLPQEAGAAGAGP